MRDIVALMSGTFVAQVVGVLFIPVLAAIYSPEEYGEYSIFMSIVATYSVIASLKYEQGIVIADSNDQARSLYELCVMINAGLAAVLLVGLFVVARAGSVEFLTLKHVFAVPLLGFMVGYYYIVRSYANRLEMYKDMSLMRVGNISITTLTQWFSRWGLGVNGLIGGKFLGEMSTSIYLTCRVLAQSKTQSPERSAKRYRLLLLRFVDFAKFQSPTSMINALTVVTPILVVGKFFGIEAAGIYGMATKLLQAPMSLIGSSAREVFFQKASKLHRAGESFLQLYLDTTVGLMKVALLPILLVLFLGDYLVGVVLGAEWLECGTVLKILVFWFFFGLVNPPSTISFVILERQRDFLIISIISFVFRVGVLVTLAGMSYSLVWSLSGFVLASVIANAVAMWYIYNRIGKIAPKFF